MPRFMPSPSERGRDDLINIEERHLLQLEAQAARQRITDPELRRRIDEQKRYLTKLKARGR